MDALRPFTIEHDGTTLHGVVHSSPHSGPRPTVVVCHGFKGFMDWGFFPSLADLLAARGFTTIRFNYSGSGQLPGEDAVSDFEAFRRNSHRRELAETLAIVRAAETEIAPGQVDPQRLALVGHSRGGAAALLAAADPSMSGRIRALVTWAAIATIDRYDDATKARWRAQGELTIVNGRTGQKLPLGLDLLEDVERGSHGALDLLAAARRQTAPWLILHGDADETVRVDDARQLDGQAGGEHTLQLIEGANHTFGTKHPFAGPTPHLTQAFNATQRWLRRHLA